MFKVANSDDEIWNSGLMERKINDKRNFGGKHVEKLAGNMLRDQTQRNFE